MPRLFYSTVAVQAGLNFHSQVAASKAQWKSFIRALAAELAPKIRVNCIAPSLTDTTLATALLNSPGGETSAQRHPLKELACNRHCEHGGIPCFLQTRVGLLAR